MVLLLEAYGKIWTV